LGLVRILKEKKDLNIQDVGQQLDKNNWHDFNVWWERENEKENKNKKEY